MRAPWKRAAILALATCSFSVLPGCKSDVERADEAVSEDIAKAGSSTPDQAVQTLTASVTKGSPLGKAQSNLVLAQAESNAAGVKLQKVWDQDAKIAALLLEMERLGWQIASNNSSLSGFQALNPAAGQQAFGQVSSAAEKGDGGPWVKGGEGAAPVPSLADVKKQQETLNAQIAELAKQRTELAARRATAIQQAENFSRQADSTRGSASSAFYIQASNQRKEAGDDEVKMRDLDAQILPLQQQLDVANEQQKSIDATLASIKDQVDKLQGGWQGVQNQMEQMKQFSSSLVGGGGAGGAAAAASQPATSQPTVSNLNQLAADLNEQVKAATEARDEAVKLLTDALKHLNDGEQQAATGLKSIPKPSGPDSKVPEKAAWQQLIDLNDPAEFKVRRAGVMGALARLYAGQYVELAQRNAVARLLDSGLKQAGVESQAVAVMGNGGAPSQAVRETVDKVSQALSKSEFAGYSEMAPELEGLGGAQPTPSDVEAIAGLRSDFYFSWADNVASDVISGNTPGELQQLRVAEAHLDRMADQYAWSKLGELQGKAQEARGRLAVAVTERKALSDNPNSKGLVPPMLPPELAEVVTSQPAGQPAEATSQPATTEPAASQPATPGAASPDSPEQAAARAVAVAFAEALAAGDTDKARTMVVEARIEYNTFANYYRNFGVFKTAAVQKFGDAAQDMPSVLPDLKDKIQKANLTVNGTTALFTTPGEGEPMKATNVNGTWKMDFAPTNPNEAIKQLQMLNIVGPVYARATISIQSGKFKTADELRQSLVQDLKTAIPGYNPPPPTSAPATAPAGQ
jgi:hypothetical protein